MLNTICEIVISEVKRISLRAGIRKEGNKSRDQI